MSKSTDTALAHGLILLVQVSFCLLSPAIRSWDQAIYDRLVFPTFAVLAVLAVIGWAPCMGGCFLTKVERRYLRMEGKRPYADPFIVHYVQQFTGRRIPNRAVTAVLIALMLVPFYVRLVEWPAR